MNTNTNTNPNKPSNAKVWSDAAKSVVRALAASDRPLSIAEMNAVSDVKILSGHISGLVKQGIILNAGTTIVNIPSKRKAGLYVFNTDEVKINLTSGKPYNYSDAEKDILNAFEGREDVPMTLAQISELVGRNLTSGNINGLVTKGNISFIGRIDVPCIVKKEVKTYINNDGAERILR